MTGRSSKRKGADAEREFAARLRELGFPNAARTPYSGADTRWKGDVMGVPSYVIEVKRQERLNIWEALRQVYAAATGGNVPVLAFRRNGSPWHVVIPLEEFARLTNVAGTS